MLILWLSWFFFLLFYSFICSYFNFSLNIDFVFVYDYHRSISASVCLVFNLRKQIKYVYVCMSLLLSQLTYLWNNLTPFVVVLKVPFSSFRARFSYLLCSGQPSKYNMSIYRQDLSKPTVRDWAIYHVYSLFCCFMAAHSD